MRTARFFLPFVALAAAVAPACGGRTLEDQPTDSAVIQIVAEGGTLREASVVDSSVPPLRDASVEGVDGGPVQKLDVIELGQVAAGATVPFTVPSGTLGFHIMVTATTPSESLAVLEVRAPNGEAVFTNATAVGGSHPSSETLFGVTAAAQVPQGNHAETTPVAPGTWTVKFRGDGPLRAKVQIQSTPDGEFHGGALDVDLYIPSGIRLGGGTAITIANAPTNAEVRGRVAAFYDAVFSLYGLSRGNLRFHGLPSRYATVEDEELGDLFQETRVAPAGQGLHIVLSDSDDSSEWWGIAMGIPGAANSPGNEQSGLALASVPGADADVEGLVLAHEAGHFFGLNHTTEFRGDADPLPDTPVCTNISEETIESCPDFDNIMFFAGAIGNATSSLQQRRVVQGSPIFRAFQTGVAPTPRGIRRTPDIGKLFGHPGVAPTRGERLALLGTCGHPSHRDLRLSSASRASLVAVTKDPKVAPLLRNAAARLLAQP